MRKPHRMAVALLALGMMTSGCYGPFYLVRKVWKFNGEVSDNKWVVEVVYLVMSWLPVYGIAGLADAIIFNSIEFWTGDNPLAESADAGTKKISRGDTEVIMKRNGNEVVVEQFRKGEPAGTMRLQREGNGTVAMNGDGAVLFKAETMADGSVTITDGNGQQIASYTGDEARKLIASVPQ